MSTKRIFTIYNNYSKSVLGKYWAQIIEYKVKDNGNIQLLRHFTDDEYFDVFGFDDSFKLKISRLEKIDIDIRIKEELISLHECRGHPTNTLDHLEMKLGKSLILDSLKKLFLS